MSHTSDGSKKHDFAAMAREWNQNFALPTKVDGPIHGPVYFKSTRYLREYDDKYMQSSKLNVMFHVAERNALHKELNSHQRPASF